MPPKNPPAAEGTDLADENGLSFTAVEIKLINAVFKLSSTASKPSPNWDAVATEVGSASGSSARERFRQIGKKYGWFEVEPAPSEEGGPAKTPKSRKASATKTKKARTSTDANVNEDGEEGADPTPTKKRRASGTKKTKKAKEQEIQDHDGNDAGVVAEQQVARAAPPIPAMPVHQQAPALYVSSLDGHAQTAFPHPVLPYQQPYPDGFAPLQASTQAPTEPAMTQGETEELSQEDADTKMFKDYEAALNGHFEFEP